MSEYRTDEEVRNYDLFKGVVAALLAVAVFVLYAASRGDATVATGASPTPEAAADTVDDEIADIAPAELLVAAPDLLSPAPGTELEAGAETFSGMGTPGTQVALVAGGAELGRTLVDENGTWQLEVQLPTGVQDIELQALDSAGNVVAASPRIPMTIIEAGMAETAAAGTATAAPAEEALAAPPTVDFPAGDVQAGELTLTGSGEPGTALRLLGNGAPLGTTVVDGDGTWSLQTALPAGDVAIDIERLDDEGNVVETIPALSLPVQAPQPPAFTPPELPVPEFDPLTGALVFGGASAAGARVAAVVNDAVVAETTADEDGAWQISLPLEPGSADLAFAQLDQDGNVTAQTDPVAIEVPASLPQLELPDYSLPDETVAAAEEDDVSIANPAALYCEEQGFTYEIRTADDGSQSGVCIFDDGSECDAWAYLRGECLPPGEEVEEGPQPGAEATELPAVRLPAGTFTWTGAAAPGAEVALLVDGQVAATAAADDDGSFTLSADLAPGERAVQVGLVGEDGQVIARSRAVPVAAADTSVPTVQVPEVTGDAQSVSVSGTAEAGSMVEVTVNGRPVGQVTAADDGSWSLEVPLPAQEANLRAQVVDEAGNPLLRSSVAALPGRGAAVAEAPEEATAVPEEEAGTTPEAEAAETPEAEATAVPEEEIISEPAFDIGEEAESAAEAIELSGSFNILEEGLDQAGLTTPLDDVETAYTLFAPTDAAFEAIPPSLLLAWEFSPEAYVELMRFLVVEGAYRPEDLTDGLVLQTLAGTNVGITRTGDLIFLSGVPVIDFVEVGNSVIYALPQVILPPLPAGISPPIINVEGVPTFTGPTLTVVGSAEPGRRILLTVDGEPFGSVATVQEDGTWQNVGENDLESGVRRILAYMINDRGLLEAISQEVQLPVP